MYAARVVADEDEILEGTAFKEVLTILGALATNDERIVEQFRSIANKKRPKKRIVRLDERLDEVLATDLDLAAFSTELELRCWTRLARIGWRDFASARRYVRKLGLRNAREW